jgi:beta-lactamase regulating signal transducer with metallopeptidase domain
MLAPVEFSWVRVIPSVHLYNGIYNLISKKIDIYGIGKITIEAAMAGVWVAGTLLGIAKIVRDHILIGKILIKLKRTEYFEAEKIIEKIERCYRKKQKIKVYKSKAIRSPVSVGIIKREIWIPDMDYDSKKLEHILKHELAHHVNNDILTKLIINTLCALYWWNPVVYILRINIDNYFEIRCDKTVVADMNNNDRAEYMETIVDMLRYRGETNYTCQGDKAGLLGLNEGSAGLKERFEEIASCRPTENRRPQYIFIIIGAFVLMMLSYSFIFQSQYRGKDDESNGHEIDFEKDYIIKDGSDYFIVYSDDQREVINSEYIQELKDLGMRVKNVE